MKRVALSTLGTISIAGIAMGIFLCAPRPSSAPPLANISSQSIDSKTQPLPPAEPHEMSAPKYFQIPAIGIRSPVIEVGTTASNDMATPNSNTEMGWYKNGAIPGNPGMAVLAAHTGPPNQPTVFRKLETVKRGDTIEIQDNVHAAQFEVIETAKYTPEAAPRSRIFGTSTTARLAIITCTGEWNPKDQTYSHRLVIYSVRKG